MINPKRSAMMTFDQLGPMTLIKQEQMQAQRVIADPNLTNLFDHQKAHCL